MNLKATLKLAAVLLASGGIASAQQVITFDDLGSDEAPIPAGYAGFNWSSSFWYLNSNFVPDGYHTGVVSGPNVAYDAYGDSVSFSRATAFDLTSAYLTSAFFTSQGIEVQGFNGATEVYDQTYNVADTGPTLISFGYNDITSVNFVGAGQGTQFVLDNILVNGGTVPDGGTTSLLLGGTFFVVGLLRRKLA